jgi:hypothetical protein
MKSIKNVILGYLVVLNDKSVLEKLSEAEIEIGYASITGCLDRLMTHLEHFNSSAIDDIIYDAIKFREKINGLGSYLGDVGKPSLEYSTRICAELLYEYIRY